MLADTDTLMVFGLDHLLSEQEAAPEEIAAITEWLKRVPAFRLDPNAPVTWSQGTVRGPRRLPVLFAE